MDYMTLYQKIDEYRKAKGLSVARLSYEAGISHNTLFNWREKGHAPSLPVLEGLCDALGVSLSELLSETPTDDLSENEKQLLTLWACLTNKQKQAVLQLLNSMTNP